MDPCRLDRSRVPLSVPGSLLGVSAETRVDKDWFFVRALHRFSDPRDLIGIGLAGRPKPESVDFRAGSLTLSWPGASIEAVFSGCDSLRLRAEGGVGELVVAPPDARVECEAEGTIVVTHPADSPSLKISPLGCGVQLSGRVVTFGAASCGGEICIEEIGATPDPGGSFESHRDARNQEFGEWLARFQSLYPDADAAALTEASYLFWCCQAGPKGALKRRAVFMSKNWMTGIWSWDNCFNAIALADIDPQLAWDQFLFFFDYQSEEGRVPDLITAAGADWGMTKPPVYGWTLSRLRAAHPFFRDKERLREAYEPMARQVRFWLETRDSDNDGLPEYHHGCDSGWDNGTGFIDTAPCASPDLAAWLILQLEELARVASMMGLGNDAVHWMAEAERIFQAMAARCWDGTRWHAVRAGDHRPSPLGDSLLPWLAGMVGHRMSHVQRAAVVKALGEDGRFLTAFGPATESLRSPLYEADGYWRGPIWGPSTVMAVEACQACGAQDLAKEIARRFVSMGTRFGFAENHDASTGHGLRDPGYTWTAAAWCILNRIGAKEREPEIRKP